MKFKKLVAAFALGATLVAGNAAAIVVGGVDFGVLGLTNHIETTTLAETLVLADGQTLDGYGVVNTVNGDSTYNASGLKLYYTFTNYTSQNFSATSSEFTGGEISIFLGAEFNLLNQSSATNVATIQSYSEWAFLTGHGDLGGGATANATLSATGTLTGAAIAFNGAGLLDVDTSGAFGLAAVAAYLDANGEADAAGGFADIPLTTSGNNSVLNPFDTCTGAAGEWCIAGSADLRGDTNVPEPSTLGLMGLGLVGAAVFRRKAKKS